MTQKIIQTEGHQLAVARAIIERKDAEIRKLRLALSSKVEQANQEKKQQAMKKYNPLLHKSISESHNEE